MGKMKRDFGGQWEGSVYLAEFEQWARLALSAYENLNEMMLYTARPVLFVRGYTEDPSNDIHPCLEFEPIEPPPDFVDTLKKTQQSARHSLIRLLDEIGMKADAVALRMLDSAIDRAI